MSQITANCRSAKQTFGYAGPIGMATPFVDGTDLFQRICYTPPYITETNDALDCVDTFATMKGCAWDLECGLGEKCQNAICTPTIETAARFTNGNEISAINPKATHWFRRDDARVGEFIPSPFNESAAASEHYLLATCPSSSGVLVTECNGAQCGPNLVCPYFNGHPQMNNCTNCVRNLHKCDLFRGSMNEIEYQQCKTKENTFLYDIAMPNGQIHPLGYKINPESMATVQEALTECARDCTVTTNISI
jgi:hypothetical protein